VKFRSPLIYKAICAFLCIFIFGTIAAPEAICAYSGDNISSYIEEIIAYNLNKADAEDVQAWINGDLCNEIGGGDWYIIALSQYLGDTVEYSTYAKAFLEYVNSVSGQSLSTYQKYCLILKAFGCKETSFALSVCQRELSGQGIMSLVYGLHMLNNGYTLSASDANGIIDGLISRVNEDGGWALSGKKSDADVTAMVITALAPFYKENVTVKAAVDRAVNTLSLMQGENGEYKSYGVENPESASQVVVALSSLGIDAGADERFIKGGKSLIDVILSYKLSKNGYCSGYSHVKNGDVNGMATVQALCAFVAYHRFLDGKTPLYIFDTHSVEVSDGLLNPPVDDKEENKENNSPSYKKTVCICVTGAAIAALVLLFALKRARKGNVVLLIAAALGIIALVLFTDIKSPDEYYGKPMPPKENSTGTVTISISCDAIKNAGGNDYVPKDGVILPITQAEIAQGETVYDILVQAARQYKIHLDNDTASAGAYIKGIGYIYHFDFGELSGWVYSVNGETPSVGCDKYVLKDGDVIKWEYTLELGIAKGGD